MALDIISQLRKVDTFRNLDKNQLEWLKQKGQLQELKSGEVLFKKGDPVDQMHIILQGILRLSIQQSGQMREVGLLEEGSITGILPYSRMSHASGFGTAMEDTVILSLSKSHFTEMIQEQHELVESLVHTMTTRVRNFTRMQQQNDKMMALGKLSAGLAHELNNPSSAVVRSSSELKKQLSHLQKNFRNISKINLSEDAIAQIGNLLQKKTSEKDKVKLTMMQKSAREDELLDWLYDHNWQELEEIVENLVEFDFNIVELESITEHDIEQDLPAILQWINDNLTTEKLVAEIEEASRRINDLVTSVKSYTHMDKAPEKQMTDLHTGIDNTLTMLQHKIRKGSVELIKDYQPGLPNIKIFVSEINQVWTNIIDNALDAMENSTSRQLEIITRQVSDTVQVLICDTGPGIPTEILDDIFDPFYTTKPIGKGTGLGLDIVKRIIEQHKGSINVNSKPGKTIFKICLPIN